MKQQLLDIAKGSVMGVANVIPGLSGGTIAVILGVYDRFVNALKDLLTHPIKSIRSIWGLLVGMLIGVVVAIFLVVRLIEIAPIPTTLLFVGLIVGAIPKMAKSFDIKQAKWGDLMAFLVMIAIIVVLPFLPHKEAADNQSIVLVIILCAVGILVAMAMVVPGISGSMLLMVVGYYFYIADLLETFIKNIAKFAIGDAFSNFLVLIPFIIGLILGVVLIAKAISYLLVKYPKTVYAAIIGLLIASPFAIIYAMIEDYPEALEKNFVINIIIGIVGMIGGALLTHQFSKMEQTHE